MGKSQQFPDVKAAAYTARAPSWLRELTRSVAMAMGWLFACAIVVLIAGFAISVLFWIALASAVAVNAHHGPGPITARRFLDRDLPPLDRESEQTPKKV